MLNARIVNLTLAVVSQASPFLGPPQLACETRLTLFALCLGHQYKIVSECTQGIQLKIVTNLLCTRPFFPSFGGWGLGTRLYQIRSDWILVSCPDPTPLRGEERVGSGHETNVHVQCASNRSKRARHRIIPSEARFLPVP